MSASYTYRFDADAEGVLRDLLLDRGFRLEEAPYAHFAAKAPGCSVTFYHSGKLLIQGKNAPYWAETLSPVSLLGGANVFSTAIEQLPDGVAAWIGSDESGKGDYFGPLVVCATVVDRSQLALLAELGVADCKQLSDPKVRELAPQLKAVVPHSSVVLKPERYNTLYAEMGANLNRLLAWSHARAIEDLLEERPDLSLAVVDRFGPETRLQRALMSRGRQIKVIQRPRAEDDPAVAMASILARDTFVRHIRRLERTFGVKLQKGAGPKVLAAARQLVRECGRETLTKVAKLHFKTTDAIGVPGR